MTIDPAVVIAAIGALVTGFTTALRIIYVDLTRQRDWWREDSQMWQQRAFDNERLANNGTELAAKATAAALRKRG